MIYAAEIRQLNSSCGPMPERGYIVDYDNLRILNGVSGSMLIDAASENEARERFQGHCAATGNTVRWCDVTAAWGARNG